MSELKQNLHEFSVTELSNVLKRTVEETFSYVRVRGEISGFKRAPSGHLYFNLKDDKSVLASICWKGVGERLPFNPEDGLEVVAEGKLSTYPARSNYQLVVAKMEPAGEGALMALLEERKRKLAAEGLFAEDRKQALPFIPKVIGVITSPTGAVIRDILHRLSDRFPRHVLVWPVQVQGEAAAGQVVKAIEGFNAMDLGGAVPKPDILIVARGGGSLEDLWAFNEEVVVRAVAASDIPLISAVGHETDTTLIDFASDRRAPTPTAAAEMAVPVKRDLEIRLGDIGQRQEKARDRYFAGLSDKLSGLSRGLPTPKDILGLALQKLDDISLRLPRSLMAFVQGQNLRLERQVGGLNLSAIRQGVQIKKGVFNDFSRRLHKSMKFGQETRLQTFKGLTRTFESLSYQGVLRRGFAVIRDDAGKTVVAATAVSPGKALDIEFRDGHVPVVAKGGGGENKNPKPRPKKAKTSGKDQGKLF